MAKIAGEYQQTERLDYLDGLRAIAALYVMCAHGFMGWNIAAFGYAHAAVTVFIVLSGFCLMLPVARGGFHGGARAFYARRARRILPPYFAALALGIAVAPLAAHPLPPRDFARSIGEHLWLMHDFGAFPYGVSIPLWSVAVEWHIYLFFPILAAAWAKWGVGRMTACAVLLSLAAEHWSPFRSPSMHYYGDFAIGMAGASIAYSRDALSSAIRTQARWPACAGLLMCAMAVLLAALGTERYETIRDVVDFPVAILTAAVLIACSAPSGSGWRAALSAPWLVKIGGFSYSLYLVHAPLLLLADRYGAMPAFGPPALARALYFLPVVLAAYGFHGVFERPFAASRKRTLWAAESITSA